MKKFISYSLLILAAISMIGPFLIMVLISFSSQNQLSFTDMGGVVQNLTLNNYSHVTDSIPVGRYFFNSCVVSVLTTIGQIIVSTLAGYAFARIKFRGRNLIFFIIRIFNIILHKNIKNRTAQSPSII